MGLEKVFTNVVLARVSGLGKFYVFYEGDKVAYCYHSDDITLEMSQAFFVCDSLQHMGKVYGARMAGKVLLLKGIDKDHITALECKLISYQLKNKIISRYQIELEGF